MLLDLLEQMQSLDPLEHEDPLVWLDLTELRDPLDLMVSLDLWEQALKMDHKDPEVSLDPLVLQVWMEVTD